MVALLLFIIFVVIVVIVIVVIALFGLVVDLFPFVESNSGALQEGGAPTGRRNSTNDLLPQPFYYFLCLGQGFATLYPVTSNL